MEHWIDASWPIRYSELIRTQKFGCPTVRSEADFHRPSEFGEMLDIELNIGRVGQRSFEMQFQVWGQGDPSSLGPRVFGRTVCVLMDLDSQRPGFRRAVEIPPEYRQVLLAYTSSQKPEHPER